MPPAWTSGSRMDTAAWSRLGMAEVGSLVIRHHRPRQAGQTKRDVRCCKHPVLARMF